MYVVKDSKMEELIELLICRGEGWPQIPLCDTEWWELFDQEQLSDDEKEFFFQHRT